MSNKESDKNHAQTPLIDICKSASSSEDGTVTNIHRYQYIPERGRLFLEKITWSVIMIIVSYFCIILIVKGYKWAASPVIDTSATTVAPISEIPFPAITICPEAETASSGGLCYTFKILYYSEILNESQEYTNRRSLNNPKAQYWPPKNAYSDDDTFPDRTFVSGINGGFEDVFYTNQSHLDHLCRELWHAYKVTLDHPYELPNMDHHFLVLLNHTSFAISSRVITSSESLRTYKTEDRKCYLPEEKILLRLACNVRKLEEDFDAVKLN